VNLEKTAKVLACALHELYPLQTGATNRQKAQPHFHSALRHASDEILAASRGHFETI
jgi:hypothetical protein